jgi:hypothetical protein
MVSRWAAWVVAAVVALSILLRLHTLGPIGTGYLDERHGIEAQDEAVYSHAAIRMVETGDWATPYFLDRYFLYKPPLLYWLSAGAVRLLGVSRWTLRLASGLAAAVTCLLVFVWVRRQAGLPAALLSEVLLVTSPGFFTIAARNMTDGLLCLWITLAAWILFVDPKLRSSLSVAAYGLATAAAILVKSTAGLLPVLILGAYWLVSRDRPSWLRCGAASAAGVALALPWFLYQYRLHPRWFWSEFVGVELLAWGAGAPPQQAVESVWRFYGGPLLEGAPAIVAVLALSVAAWFRHAHERAPAAMLLLAWLGVTALAIWSFQYRNATYLLPLLPVMVIAAGSYAGRNSLAAVTVIWFGFLMFWKPASTPGALAARSLQDYCALGRERELIIVNAPDQFHASVLPLHKVRYAFPGEGQPPKGFALDFRAMGIAMPASEFLMLERERARYTAVLREWGLTSDAALATVITFPRTEELARLIENSPDKDFLVPLEYARAAGIAQHERSDLPGFLLLLARGTAERRAVTRSCRL